MNSNNSFPNVESNTYFESEKVLSKLKNALNSVNTTSETNQNPSNFNTPNKFNMHLSSSDENAFSLEDLPNLKKLENESFISSKQKEHYVEVTEEPDVLISEPPVSNFRKNLSFIILFFAMFAIASGGVAMKKFPEEIRAKPILISQWRVQTSLIFFIPLCIVQLIRMKKEERSHLKSYRLWFFIFLASIGSAFWTGTWAVAMNYTSLTRAYLLNNCQPLVMVIWTKISGKKVGIHEVIGVLIGIVGLFVTCGLELVQGPFSPTQLIGDVVAFSGSIFACLYINMGGKAREKIPSLVYLTPVTLLSTLIFVITTILMEHSSGSEIFGWYHLDVLPVISYYTCVPGLLGISLLAVILKHVPPMIISIVLLFEPIAASIMAIVLKVEPNPSYIVWIGAALVTLGIVIVTIGHYVDLPKKFKILKSRFTSQKDLEKAQFLESSK